MSGKHQISLSESEVAVVMVALHVRIDQCITNHKREGEPEAGYWMGQRLEAEFALQAIMESVRAKA